MGMVMKLADDKWSRTGIPNLTRAYSPEIVNGSAGDEVPLLMAPPAPRPSEVDRGQRTIAGYCCVYDRTTDLVPFPGGERLRPGCFNRSIEGGRQIFLNIQHDESQTVGRSIVLQDRPKGLFGVFHVRASAKGDELLEEAHDGYWPNLSVTFRARRQERASDGAVEVAEAFLANVALCRLGAYQEALVTQVTRSVAEVRAWAEWTRTHRPEVDLSPLPEIPGQPPAWFRALYRQP